METIYNGIDVTKQSQYLTGLHLQSTLVITIYILWYTVDPHIREKYHDIQTTIYSE